MQACQVDRAAAAPAIARLWSLEYPEMRKTPEMVTSEFGHNIEGCFEEYWLFADAVGSGGVLALVDYDGGNPPVTLWVDFCIDPSREKDLLEPILDLGDKTGERYDVRKYKAWTNSRMDYRAEVLQRRGYEKVQIVPLTRLDLAAADLDRFQKKVDSVRSAGIEITTMAALDERGLDWVPLLHEATKEMALDMPSPDEPQFMELEQFRELVKDERIYKRDLMFAALDQGRLVGYSRVMPSDCDAALVYTGLSGVVRSHRRRGIVTALKLAGIRELQRRGYRWLQTDNDHTNPMYELNLQLGYKPFLEWWFWTRKLDG